MRTLIACRAAYGVGGVGQHFAQAVEDLRASDSLESYVAVDIQAGDPLGQTVRVPWVRPLSRLTPVRFSPAWQNYLDGNLFDRAVARQIAERPVPDVFAGFVGMALHSFRAARRGGSQRLELYALNTHVSDVRRQHARAAADWPLERSWMNAVQERKTLAEYAEADVIYIHSDHVWRTFVEHGVPERKLRRYHLRPDPRFHPAVRNQQAAASFHVVYVGGLNIWKGTPVLVEAFRRLRDPQARLTLVGGWGTRGMRGYMEAALRSDPRVRVEPGDPLPHLGSAHVYVHPSYNDGHPYSLQEAIACGLPVIVTNQTGGYDEVAQAGGIVLPAGDVAALTRALLRVKENSRQRVGAPQLTSGDLS